MDAYDLPTLFQHREVLCTIDAGEPATLSFLTPPQTAARVALLPGSFNPPTAAHLLLAERALGDGFDVVVFVLAHTTMGKGTSGLILEDRLLALRMIAHTPELAIAVCSAGLYCDQAEAATRAFPGADVSFLVGSDKVIQIFEDRWYADREDSLRRLFDRATLVVSPRGDGGEAVRRTLEEPRNAPFASRVSTLPLHPAVSDLSSTRVRGLLQSGADSAGLVPPSVAAFLAQIGAFAGPASDDHYAMRSRVIDALWSVKEWAARSADLRALIEAGVSNTPAGRTLRAALSNGSVTVEDFKGAVAPR